MGFGSKMSFLAALGTLSLLALSLTVSAPASGQSRQQQQMIDQLRELIRKAERNRAADRWLLEDLRSLVRKYDRPWGAELLREDFSDGDFTRSPAWTVAAGKFFVDRRLGLVTDVRGGQKSPPAGEAKGGSDDPTAAILGALIDRALKNKQKNPPPQQSDAGHGEIFLRRSMPNSFSIRVEMGARRSPGRLVFGPYDGRARDRGYRLAVNPGDKTGLEIYRATRRGTVLVASYKSPLPIADGRYHSLEWTRDRGGGMSVVFDGKKLIQASDRDVMGGFNGITFVNFDGEFILREIVVLGER